MAIIPLVTFVASGLFVAHFFRSRSAITSNTLPSLPSSSKLSTSFLQKTSVSMSVSSPSPPSEEFVVRLQHPGSCTGMFWRGDPNTNSSSPSNDNWPRNGALLRGTGPYVVRGESYFKVSAIQQTGTTGFTSVPEGTWMLYNQGGLLLHKVD